jgi:nucleoid DNA-binding protein
MSITIKELTAVVAENGGITKTAAEKLVSSVFDAIGATLKAGEPVTIRNFGRFYTKVRPARAARNPKTGEAVQVAEKTVFKFVPRGDLK